MKNVLSNVEGWMSKAEAHAKAVGYDPNTLIDARLFPDQFSFVQQVQATADISKFTASRVSGREAPKHEDAERTFDELRRRLEGTVEYLETFSAEEIEGGASRVVPLPFDKTIGMLGSAYVYQFALPNFFFHAGHAYAILRHNGVPLAKRDYLKGMEIQKI